MMTSPRLLLPTFLFSIAIAITGQASAAPEQSLDGQVAAEHAHTGVAALASCSNDDRLARQNAELMHHDMVKFDEHVALLQLVPSCAATHVAIQSGAWTDPQTWRDGKVPDANARVVIPDAVTVRLEQKIGDVLEWIRVDGRLSFAAHVDTALS